MNKRLKYDFHCHINEGSKDSKVYAKQNINILIGKGFSGCLITDHDTYNGYKHIKKNINIDNFCVLKGIEYSTIDAGHIIVIMPDEYDSKEIKHLGMKLKDLIHYVHTNGGILGPAHPFSEPYLSTFSSNKYKNDYDICSQFDFIEVFNAGEKKEENDKALDLARKYSLPTIGGSDSHYIEHCGTGYIEVEEIIKTNNELIKYIKDNRNIYVNGELYVNQDREKYDKYGKLIYYLSHLQTKIKAIIHK